MRGFGVFCFLGLISFQVFATEYVRFDDLKKDQKEAWAKQARATVPLGFNFTSPTTLTIPGADPVGVCTAVIVGPNGEALSNLHCFESCLYNNNAATLSKVPGTNLSSYEVKTQSLPVTCNIKMDKKSPIEIKQAEILHVFGKGWISDRNALNDFMNAEPEKYLSLISTGIESSGDLILIKLPVTSPSCVELGDADFNSLNPVDVVSLSYPIVFRKDSQSGYMAQTFFTMGLSLLWSTGQATSNEELLAPNLSPTLLSNIDIITPPGVVITSTDTEPGASGSPLFDKNGKLVAITRSTWKGLTGDYVPWTSGAVDLTQYKNWLKENIKNIEQCAN